MRWLFFFLFFLHGTSIGTRQQGISYNVISLGEVGKNKPELSNLKTENESTRPTSN